jgi:hypothetical protein
MMIKKIIVLLCSNIIVLATFAQLQKHQEDSIKANSLIHEKLTVLKSSGAKTFLYLFSDAGCLAILYELNGKVRGERAYYKGNKSSKFKRLKITNDVKLNYSKCIEMASKDTTVNFSNCREYVHSFSRIVFLVTANNYTYQGVFTSDCSNALEKNGLMCLYSIYKQLIL